MSDLISREQAIKAMQESEFGYTFEVDVAIEAVKALPTVEPEWMGKMSEDLISRKEMIRAVDSLGEDYISYYKLLMLINRLPSAEPERTKGKWVDGLPYVNSHWWICSVCHVPAPENHTGYNFCPHCGADMR